MMLTYRAVAKRLACSVSHVRALAQAAELAAAGKRSSSTLRKPAGTAYATANAPIYNLGMSIGTSARLRMTRKPSAKRRCG